MITLVVTGACGKMGKAMLEKIALEEDVKVVGAVDFNNTGIELSTVIAAEKFKNIYIENNLEKILQEKSPS